MKLSGTRLCEAFRACARMRMFEGYPPQSQSCNWVDLNRPCATRIATRQWSCTSRRFRLKPNPFVAVPSVQLRFELRFQVGCQTSMSQEDRPASLNLSRTQEYSCVSSFFLAVTSSCNQAMLACRCGCFYAALIMRACKGGP